MTPANTKNTQRQHKQNTIAQEKQKNSLVHVLAHVEELMTRWGNDFTKEREHMHELGTRISHARYHLAVLGQFKRGKSTLLNALLGEPFLPSALLPLTSIPTFISWGENRRAKVVFHDGHAAEASFEKSTDVSEFLARYVTEEGNPKNKLFVARVEVECPTPLLKGGLVLIDTPGIGSTFQHNTEMTFKFLPQCDGAFFLVSAEPPITQLEVEFLKEVRTQITRLFLIMNKTDYLTEDERKTAVEFFQKVIQEQPGVKSAEPVFSVSARQGLEAKRNDDSSLWAKSGMADLEKTLLEFLVKEKRQALNIAIAKKAADILGNMLLQIRLKQRSLTLPLDDLEQRLAVFEKTLQETEIRRTRSHDTLAGDQHRILELLEEQSAHMLRDAQATLFEVLEDILKTFNGNSKAIEISLRTRLQEAIPEIFEAAMATTVNTVGRQVQDCLDAHQEQANALLNTIRQAATELFEVPYTPSEETNSLALNREPYWVTETWSVSLSPIPRGMVERLLPKNIAQRRIRRWLQNDIESIVSRNVGDLRWAMIQNVNDTIRRFALRLQEQFEEITKTTHGAIRAARDQRIRKADTVAEELSKLALFESEIQRIHAELTHIYLPAQNQETPERQQ